MKNEPQRKTPRPAGQPKPGNRFVELMFSGLSHPNVALPRARARAEEPYHALPQLKSTPGERYRLPLPAPLREVHASSPAIDVMTDLGKVPAVTIRRLATIEEATRTMIARGVRALFVVDNDTEIVGIVTSTDTQGEKPILLTQQRGIRYDEVMVRDIMTPAERLEAMELADVLNARVGDVVATLKLSGRQHALVIDGGSAEPTVRGIFSLTQIARQLGLAPQPVHDIGRTFLEIEAALGR